MMKTYPAYKDSGLPWLGQVPTHWEVIRNKFVFREVEERSKFGHETLLSLTRSRGLIPQAEHTSKESSADSLEGYRLCRPGQIVMNRMQAWSGMFDAARLSGLVSPDYTVLAPKVGVNTEFAAHWFRSPRVVCEFRKKSRGIGSGFFRLYTPDFGDVAIPLPPRDEQDAIVAFLESKQREMDAFIANKQRTIALLLEQKAALINRAVTRGLDTNAPLKPSGVDWLGGVPASWELKKLKFVAAVQTGLTLGKTYDPTAVVSRPYLRVANVQDGFLDLSEVTTIELPAREAARYELKEGDVLMTEGGDFDKLGRGYVWESQIAGCLHQNHVFAVRPDRAVLSPSFLSAVMTSSHGKNYFTFTSKKTTNLASTNSTKIGNFLLPLPSLQEQQQVLQFIANGSIEIERAIATSRREITLMQEYRAALIAEAATGRMDVRSHSSDGFVALADTVAGGFYSSDNAGTATGETPPTG